MYNFAKKDENIINWFFQRHRSQSSRKPNSDLNL